MTSLAHPKSLSGLASRREATKSVGGLLAVLAAVGLGSKTLAQDTTPETGGPLDGRYLAVRVRQVRPDASAEERAQMVRDGFMPLVRAIEGYAAYFLFYNDENRQWASISIFADKTGADASTAVAADWGRQTSSTDFFESADPTVLEGWILISDEAVAPA
jgi:hypothetical protein